MDPNLKTIKELAQEVAAKAGIILDTMDDSDFDVIILSNFTDIQLNF